MKIVYSPCLQKTMTITSANRGFNMHAGVFADSHETVKLEHLCRYIARPAISEQRLSLTDSGKVRAEVTASQRGKNSPRYVEPRRFPTPYKPQ